MKTKEVPFEIYIPANENRDAIKVATIQIEVVTDASGQEMVTPESAELIDKTQARYMGLLAGADIKALRKKLNLSQSQLSDLIGCGKKSVSRWENGHEYMVGYVLAQPGFPKEKMQRAVEINGPSMLFGAAREILRAATGRGPYGPVLIPSTSFFKPEKKAPAKKAVKKRTVAKA